MPAPRAIPASRSDWCTSAWPGREVFPQAVSTGEAPAPRFKAARRNWLSTACACICRDSAPRLQLEIQLGIKEPLAVAALIKLLEHGADTRYDHFVVERGAAVDAHGERLGVVDHVRRQPQVNLFDVAGPDVDLV